VTRHSRNRINKTKVKHALKAARLVIGQGPEVYGESLKKAMSTLHKASSKGAIHPKNASRRISRLAKKFHQAAPAAPAVGA
jgi:small subunit ribosomal protein S20